MLGVGQATVSRQLSEVYNRWLQENADKVGHVRRREHARLLRELSILEMRRETELGLLEAQRAQLSVVEEELRAAWLRSQQDRRQTKQQQMVKRTDAGLTPSGEVMATVTTEGQVGHPSFVRGLADIIEQRRKVSETITTTTVRFALAVAELHDRIRRLFGLEEIPGGGAPADTGSPRVLVIRVGKNGNGNGNGSNGSGNGSLPTARRLT